MKYHDLMKGSQDVERTSSGRPTDRQVQSNMPLFFEGGHKNYTERGSYVLVFSMVADEENTGTAVFTEHIGYR
jgi:hypothetical protein